MSLRVCTLLAVLMVTTQQIQARSSQRGGPMAMVPYDQDTADIVYEQAVPPTGSEEVASLMYQMMQRAAQLQGQEEDLKRQEEIDEAPNPQVVSMFDESFVNEDKRGSYMSLCHFKICNMGRKRNLRRSEWSRF